RAIEGSPSELSFLPLPTSGALLKTVLNFNRIGAARMPDESTSRATSALHEFLKACAALGEARVVLRNCSAFMEMFCSADRLSVSDRWLTIRLPQSHMHVELTR